MKMCHQCFLRLGFFTSLLLVSTYSLGTETDVLDPLESGFGSIVHASLMIANLKTCEMYKKLAEEAFSPIYEPFEDVIHYIETQTGLNFNGAHMRHIFHMLEQLEDAFFIYRECNFTLPSWISKVLPEPLQTILSKTQRNTTFSTEINRFAAGSLLSSIISDMHRKIRDDNFEEVLHLYSGHDTTVRRCLTALRVFGGQRVPYGTTVIIELRRKENTSYYVTVSLKNETDGSPHTLQIPGCAGLNCSFHQFEYLTRTLVPYDWEKECEIPHTGFDYFVPGVVLLLVICLCISVLLYKTRTNTVAKSRFESPET